MACCQQQKFPPTTPPQPHKQNVTVTCKAYHNKCMDNKDGVVKLVDSPQVGNIYWEKITFDKTASNPVPFFLLVKDDKALARPDPVAPGDKVVLLDYKYDPSVDPDKRMLWNDAQIKEFTPISTAISIPVGNILNLDVHPSTLEIVVKTPKIIESQLWQTASPSK